MSRSTKNDKNKRKTRIYSNCGSTLQRRRKKSVQEYFVKAIILFVLIIITLSISIRNNNKSSICYKENSNVDYKVYLKENEFYDKNYSQKDNQYIASLIDYIVADFCYDLEIYEFDIKYDYKYRLEAEVNVEEKETNKSIYNFEDVLVPEKKFEGKNDKTISIKEKVNIDYNKYNDLIKKFVTIYDLDEAIATLTIKMCINIEGIDGNFQREESDEYLISLDIPLTTKTVGIDLNTNLIGCENELITCETNKMAGWKILILVLVFMEIRYIVKLCKYMSKNRTPEDIYRLELNKILSNYGSYIQKINNEFNMKKYEIITIDKFNDILEIRDTIQEPILRFESEEELKTYFMIPSKNQILYVYELSVNNENK